MVGVPHLAALNRVLAKLKANQIEHFAWTEPDYAFGFTAIATCPLNENVKQALSNYRVWSMREARQETAACGVTPDSRSTYAGSSEKEHSLIK